MANVLYIHHTLPNFNETMNRLHNAKVDSWDYVDHHFLRHPKWDGMYHNVTAIVEK